jgi:hypothetical protein
MLKLQTNVYDVKCHSIRQINILLKPPLKQNRINSLQQRKWEIRVDLNIINIFKKCQNCNQGRKKDKRKRQVQNVNTMRKQFVKNCQRLHLNYF